MGGPKPNEEKMSEILCVIVNFRRCWLDPAFVGWNQARFYVGAGGGHSPPSFCPGPPVLKTVAACNA